MEVGRRWALMAVAVGLVVGCAAPGAAPVISPAATDGVGLSAGATTSSGSPTEAAVGEMANGAAPPQRTRAPTADANAAPSADVGGTAGPRAPFTPLPLQTPVPGGLDPRFGIAEGFRDPAVMARIGAGWERVVISWADIQPDGPGDFSWLGRTLPPRALAGELNRGVRMAGLLQFTPAWAATDLNDPGRSVPQNLDLPDDDPNNYWAQFVYETVRYYRGRIDEWIVWNEPEFHPGDAAGSGSYTWLGTDAQFARLMMVAYVAAKRANPNALVAFPGTSYWVDQNSHRPQFYERFLKLIATDPRAAANNYFHDAVPLNLYRAPDDLVRLHQEFVALQHRYGVDKPMWLLELNAMPTDDRTIPCADVHAGNPIQTTQSQQADYAIQALAIAAAAGYQRISFYQMIDDDPCRQSAVWGITRDDGSERPVATTLETAVRVFAGFSTAQFTPLVRQPARWSAWPGDPASLTPNWQIYAVTLDFPDDRRATVLWNGDGVPRIARLTQRDAGAKLLDAAGHTVSLSRNGSDWLIDLPPATAHYPDDPPGYYFIGGQPRILLETGVQPGTTVTPPRQG